MARHRTFSERQLRAEAQRFFLLFRGDFLKMAGFNVLVCVVEIILPTPGFFAGLLVGFFVTALVAIVGLGFLLNGNGAFLIAGWLGESRTIEGLETAKKAGSLLDEDAARMAEGALPVGVDPDHAATDFGRRLNAILLDPVQTEAQATCHGLTPLVGLIAVDLDAVHVRQLQDHPDDGAHSLSDVARANVIGVKPVPDLDSSRSDPPVHTAGTEQGAVRRQEQVHVLGVGFSGGLLLRAPSALLLELRGLRRCPGHPRAEVMQALADGLSDQFRVFRPGPSQQQPVTDNNGARRMLRHQTSIRARYRSHDRVWQGRHHYDPVQRCRTNATAAV